MNRLCIQCTYFFVSWFGVLTIFVSYRFRFCTAALLVMRIKIKKYGQYCHICFERLFIELNVVVLDQWKNVTIQSSDWNERFIIYLFIYIYLKVSEKVDWNVIFNLYWKRLWQIYETKNMDRVFSDRVEWFRLFCLWLLASHFDIESLQNTIMGLKNHVAGSLVPQSTIVQT